jgi:hypothetical protein
VKVATVDIDDVVEILGDIALAKGVVAPADQRTAGEARDGVITTSAHSYRTKDGRWARLPVAVGPDAAHAPVPIPKDEVRKPHGDVCSHRAVE